MILFGIRLKRLEMGTDQSKKELLDELRKEGLLSECDSNELFEIVVENDKKELEKVKKTFSKNFEEFYRLSFR